MSEQKYICDLNLRPRVEGKPVYLEAGTEFDGSMIDEGTLEELTRQGHIKPVGEAPEAPEEEAPEEEASEAPEEEAPEEEEEAPKPTGIWNFKEEDIKDFSLLELNAIYKQRADLHDIEVTSYKSKPHLIRKLCSENNEG